MKSRAEHPAHPAVWLSVLPSTRLLSVLGDQLLDKFSEFLSGHHQPTPIGRMLRCDWILARPPRERFMSGTWHEGRIGVFTSSIRGSRKSDKIIRRDTALECRRQRSSTCLIDEAPRACAAIFLRPFAAATVGGGDAAPALPYPALATHSAEASDSKEPLAALMSVNPHTACRKLPVLAST